MTDLTETPRFEPRTVGAKNLPTDCCEFGVVDLKEGIEVCRVWREDYARKIAHLLNNESKQETGDEEDMRLLRRNRHHGT
tara:strand:- start:9519 stop:9758 length:240 start_codon:yes stop_codon:yes gene_type:complete